MFFGGYIVVYLHLEINLINKSNIRKVKVNSTTQNLNKKILIKENGIKIK